MASSGLTWLLRFVSAPADGAPSVGVAMKSATSGIPVQRSSLGTSSSRRRGQVNDSGDVDQFARPLAQAKGEDPYFRSGGRRGKVGRGRQGRSEANSGNGNIGPSENPTEADTGEECIICRCEDADGEINGPLGYLGHEQRSWVMQLRPVAEETNPNASLAN